MLITMGVHFIIKLLMINCNYLIQNQVTPNFFQCEKYNMPASQVYGTAVLSPAHALKSTFGIEELAQATLWFKNDGFKKANG